MPRDSHLPTYTRAASAAKDANTICPILCQQRHGEQVQLDHGAINATCPSNLNDPAKPHSAKS